MGHKADHSGKPRRRTKSVPRLALQTCRRHASWPTMAMPPEGTRYLNLLISLRTASSMIESGCIVPGFHSTLIAKTDWNRHIAADSSELGLLAKGNFLAAFDNLSLSAKVTKVRISDIRHDGPEMICFGPLWRAKLVPCVSQLTSVLLLAHAAVAGLQTRRGVNPLRQSAPAHPVARRRCAGAPA